MFSRFFRSTLAQVSALLILATSASQAAVSYLMIQADFGTGLQTHKWKVDYTAGALSSGQDLMNAVFGTPVANGTINDPWGGPPLPYYASTQPSTGQGAGYSSYSFGYMLATVTLGGSTVTQTDALSWNYLVAGGDGSVDPYDDGIWVYADDGLATRVLTDGSFDSWIFGAYGVESVGGTGVNSPTAANFQGTPVFTFNGTGYTVSYFGATNIPEPGKGVLLMLAGLVFVLRRKR